MSAAGGMEAGKRNVSGDGAGRVGAFFDLDGTLLPAPSLERRFVGYLLRRRVIRVSAIARWIVGVLEEAPIGTPFAEADREYLAGLSCALAEEWLDDPRAQLPYFSEGIGAMERHAARGEGIFIVSGTLAPLARAVARRLPGRVRVCATELMTRESSLVAENSKRGLAASDSGAAIWSGRLGSEWVNGDAKGRAVQQFAGEFELDLPRCFAYGDSAGDIPMLESVGLPCAVNASFGLRRVARARGWRNERWRREIAEWRICRAEVRADGDAEGFSKVWR